MSAFSLFLAFVSVIITQCSTNCFFLSLAYVVNFPSASHDQQCLLRIGNSAEDTKQAVLVCSKMAHPSKQFNASTTQLCIFSDCTSFVSQTIICQPENSFKSQCRLKKWSCMGGKEGALSFECVFHVLKGCYRNVMRLANLVVRKPWQASRGKFKDVDALS